MIVRRVRRLVLALLVLCALAAVIAGARADARPPLETIVQDDASLLHRTDQGVAANMRILRGLGVDRVRLTAGWSVIAPDPDSSKRPEFDASDPDAYPRANWRVLDRAVREARKAGLDVMIDIAFWAPLWATDGSPGPGRARWNVSVPEFASFATAVSRRYSGTFRPKLPDTGVPPPPAADRPPEDTRPPPEDGGLGDLVGGLVPRSRSSRAETPPAQAPPPPKATTGDLDPLPGVYRWTIWNEPNHPGFLQPQWSREGEGWAPKSPHLYRRMVEAAYPAIKAVHTENVVLVGGTSSTGVGQPRSATDGMAPLRFLREMACVDRQLRPLTSGDCAGYRPLPGDGLSHHPYSLRHRPDFGAPAARDNAPIGDLSRVTRLMDALVARGRVTPGLRNLYLTEFGYESNPPDPMKPFNPAQQARFLTWSEYLAWRNPRVRSWPQFLLQDEIVDTPEMSAASGRRHGSDWQSGLFFVDGAAKPAATGFRLGLFAQCQRERGRRSLRLWGRVRSGSGPQPVHVVSSRGPKLPVTTDAGGTFSVTAPVVPGAQYRLEVATAAGEKESGLSIVPRGCSRR